MDGAYAGTNGNGTAAHDDTTPSAAPAFDPAVFRDYLLALLPPLFGTSRSDLVSLVETEGFDERVIRFAGEGGDALYVVKRRETSSDEADGVGVGVGVGVTSGEENEATVYTYELANQLAYSSANATTLALIKRAPILDSVTPLATQLHILNLFGGDETPYESLHAVVSNGVKPWFDAFVGARHGGKDGDNKMGMLLAFHIIYIMFNG